MPEIEGSGTLTSLRIAASRDPSLIAVINSILPTLNVADLATLRERATPLFAAWAEAVPVAGFSNPETRPDVPLLITTQLNGEKEVTDFGYVVTDASGSYYKLVSGSDILDSNGMTIARPQLADVLAQSISNADWTVLTGAQLSFVERQLGELIPLV